MVNPLRILIADDHELVREGMRVIIESHPGWSVCGEARTGPEALAMALKLAPDLIVLDYSLPDLNGVEVTREVRRTLSIPILIVTMHHADYIVQAALEAGANGYVLKTDVRRTITEAVLTVVSHGRFISSGVRARAPGATSSAFQDDDRPHLTPREREVFQMLAEGRTNKEIGIRCGISTKTIETHRARIMTKLGLHSISELVRFAIRNRFIEP